MAPPEGKILLPPTGCPGMGPGVGQELGSSTKALGAGFVPSRGTEQPQELPGSPHSPEGNAPTPVPIPFAFISLLFLFRVVQGQGGTEGKEMQSSCCWPLVASASDTTATQGWWRGGNAAPGSAAGSAPAACPGVAGTPHKAPSHTGGGPSTMPRAPGSVPVASPWGKGHKNPAAALAPAACPSTTAPFRGAFPWGQRFFKGIKVILPCSPLPLPPCPADPQVHSWHCSGREGREGADPPSMGKMPRLPAGAEVQTVRGEEVSGEIPFISSRGFGGHAARRGGREGEREGKGFVCSRCEAGGWGGCVATWGGWRGDGKDAGGAGQLFSFGLCPFAKSGAPGARGELEQGAARRYPAGNPGPCPRGSLRVGSRAWEQPWHRTWALGSPRGHRRCPLAIACWPKEESPAQPCPVPSRIPPGFQESGLWVTAGACGAIGVSQRTRLPVRPAPRAPGDSCGTQGFPSPGHTARDSPACTKQMAKRGPNEISD